jgi:hypothetical protein
MSDGFIGFIQKRFAEEERQCLMRVRLRFRGGFLQKKTASVFLSEKI